MVTACSAADQTMRPTVSPIGLREEHLVYRLEGLRVGKRTYLYNWHWTNRRVQWFERFRMLQHYTRSLAYTCTCTKGTRKKNTYITPKLILEAKINLSFFFMFRPQIKNHGKTAKNKSTAIHEAKAIIISENPMSWMEGVCSIIAFFSARVIGSTYIQAISREALLEPNISPECERDPIYVLTEGIEPKLQLRPGWTTQIIPPWQ